MAFTLELDHVVMFAGAGAPEAQTLAALGLTGFGGTFSPPFLPKSIRSASSG